jgi:4'-phosphopantetheinyl transferase
MSAALRLAQAQLGLAAKFGTTIEEEQRQLAALAPSERYRGFFRCWTRKEAYIRAQGTGLSLPLTQFDASLKPGDANALLLPAPTAPKQCTGPYRKYRPAMATSLLYAFGGTDGG